jgi:hypothetical protein
MAAERPDPNEVVSRSVEPEVVVASPELLPPPAYQPDETLITALTGSGGLVDGTRSTD